MIKLAITGNIASGKSLVESFLKKEGILTLDTDEVVHKLLSEDKKVIEKVNTLLGGHVLDKEGRINRREVGKIVFEDKNKLVALENILHPEVKKAVDKFFEDNKDEKIVAVSVPQLYETGWEIFFDYVLLVVADDEVRLDRLIKRNNFTKEVAIKRLKSQIPQEDKAKKADFVINNSGNPENTEIQVKEVLAQLKK